MPKPNGWTLVELLVVVAVLVLLSSLLVPSLGAAREKARLATCAAALHDIHQALVARAVIHDLRLVPFRFSSYSQPSLQESGHWGGTSQPADPVLCGTHLGSTGQLATVNLWTLVEENFLPPNRLVCPGASHSVREGYSSMFPYSTKFSTYCLRFPYSEDLFRGAPLWANYGGGDLLAVYAWHSGGDVALPGQQNDPTHGAYRQRVPLVRLDRTYRIAAEVAEGLQWGDGCYDVATDVLLADTFWWLDRSEAVSQIQGVDCHAVRANWCHRSQFNTLTGDGAVRRVTDDEELTPILNNSLPEAQTSQDVGPCGALAAERVWQFFDSAGRL